MDMKEVINTLRRREIGTGFFGVAIFSFVRRTGGQDGQVSSYCRPGNRGNIKPRRQRGASRLRLCLGLDSVFYSLT